MRSRLGCLGLSALLSLLVPSPAAAADVAGPGAVAGVPRPIAAADLPGPVAELIEAQTRLVDRAREYRVRLEAVLALEEAEAERGEAQARHLRALLDRGLVSRREVEDRDSRAAGARAKVDETRRRMAEADALMSETLAAIEVAKTPRAPQAELLTTAAVIQYQGTGDLAARDASTLETFFAERFGRPLPVSAWGQTLVHDRLGLDHRHAVDVAVHPDSEEGRALIGYLRHEGIPFLAFRGAAPGAATGAHVHVGRVSPRLRPVQAMDR